MELTSLSWLPFRPSILLDYPNATILFDCAVDMDSLGYFLPNSVVNKSTYAWLDANHHSQLKKPSKLVDCFTKIGDYVFVDAVPEVHSVSLNNVRADTIDVIVISNWMSLMALPFITERTSFHGFIYATGPTVQLGRLVLEELLNMIERVDRNLPVSNAWRDESNWTSYANFLSTNPANWSQMYTKGELIRSLEKITNVYFHESIPINGMLKISAISSGYSIGSCNWIVETDNGKIGYMAATSSRSSHIKPVDLEPFRELEILILTSLSRLPEASPENMVLKFTSAVVDTLKKGGNVLIPVTPTGVIYDLFELVYATIEKHNISRDIPIYFVSSAAESTLAYANIYSEWLSAEKSSKAYVPEDPFIHSELVKCGRIKVYENLHGAFSREFRTPCILFAGHPSLRVGEVVHFLDLWGNDPRNSVIMTDPDFPLEPFYNPYKGLAIRAYYFPIDTRLDYAQVSSNIMPDLSPHLLLMPDIYAKPIKFQDKNFFINYSAQMTFCPNAKIFLPCKQQRKRVLVDSEVLAAMKVGGHSANHEIGICAIDGFLSAYDNNLKVVASAKDGKSVSGRISVSKRRRLYGKVTADKLLKNLSSRNLSAEVCQYLDDPKLIIKVRAFNAEIVVENNRSKIVCPSASHRSTLQHAVRECLREI